MSNSDFDRGINILQGLLDTAVLEAEKAKAREPLPAEPQPASGPTAEKPPVQTEMFAMPEPEPKQAPEAKPETEAVQEQEARAEPVRTPSEPAEPPHVPCTCAAERGVSRKAAGLVAAACLGLGAVLALLLTPAPGPVSHDGCIRADALLSAEDFAAWKTASSMYGPVDGVTLRFSDGIAEANGIVYKTALDFCRNGDTTFVKVFGNGIWVACVNKAGQIVKTYPAPKNGKPLKEIFGPRSR